MNVAVIVPWRPTPEREPLWAAVRAVWSSTGWPIVTADDGGGTFSRAASINAGVRKAQGADILVIADADTLPSFPSVYDAVSGCSDGRLHLPHTQTVIQTDRGVEIFDNSLGGINVIRKDAFVMAGGFDDRFRGWGFEDNAFASRCERALGSIVRHEGVIISLYHPPCWQLGDETYLRNESLWKEYDHS